MITTVMFTTAALCAAAAVMAPPRLPSGPIPDGLGVNIHFTDPRKGEMEMLAEGGFTWVRMDYDWNQVEYEPGKYRFEAYERLMDALEAHRVRPIFILDYVHRFYDDAQSPHTDAAIEAFARFAAASAKHFQGRGILWEMYNEPNIFPFWRPKPNVDDYVRLATAVGEAIRTAAPREAYIGPAVSTMDFAFLEACFKGGLLDYWDAVSVHPYRQMAPETVIPDYARLRDLIREYAPRGKSIPIISGEWGYSSAWSGMDADKQGKMLPRQWLTNLANDVPLSIWYDWHDDGPDPKEPEHHFGTVLHPYHDGRTPVYDPKPAYLAARTLATQLRGFRFNKRLMVGDDSQHVLLFRNRRDIRLAAWTTRQNPVTVVIPASAGRFEMVDHLGRPLPGIDAGANGLRLNLTDAPVYIRPVHANAVLAAAASWERLPLDTPIPYKPSVRINSAFTNTSARPLRVSDGLTSRTLRPGQKWAVARVAPLERAAEPQIVELSLSVDGSAPIVQATRVVVDNPLTITVLPPAGGKAVVTVASPSGAPFRGKALLNAGADDRRVELPVELTPERPAVDLTVPAPGAAAGTRITGELRDASGARVLSLRPTTFVPVDLASAAPANGEGAALRILPDGDPKVSSEQSLTEEAPSEGPPGDGLRTYRIAYRFAGGWKFVRVVPNTGSIKPIEGRPHAMGVWIHGDGKGNIPRFRFADATGQTWQPDGEPITWTGWRFVVFPMDGSRSGRWGGADDGMIHYPLRWDTLFLLDSPGGKATDGVIHFAGLTLIY